ncbi:MAG: chromosome segregation protein SMC [Parachlamydiaceae bacterium]|nr:chromosome segregation protein SMC [Parachlamydiaceae bacterium]
MRLKKMSIFGFKSFAEKTTLDFVPGITCIVGPNGCGKSNISDAFRWVFGEQSAKAMRGGKMLDVIFAGSQRRQPLNYAEVSLTLTDIDGKLPIDYEEITVTRRMHRSGESEYFLNGNQVRLKDLQGLFLDSGVGRNAFSIFEQGKLDQVINYTPNERRYIFEEAAGILRFLQRKKESVKRLEQADLNLSRVKDIHKEVDQQIRTLEEQAEKAVVYKNYHVQLEKFEKTFYLHKWKTFEKKSSELSQKEDKQVEKFHILSQDNLSWKEKSEHFKTTLQQCDHELRLQNEKILTLKGQFELENRSIQNCQQRLVESQLRKKKLKQQFEELELARISRHKAKNDFERKIKILEEDWSQAESEWKIQQDQVKIQEEKMTKFRQELTTKQQNFVKCLQENSQYQSDLKQSEVRQENQIERQKNLIHRLEQFKEDERHFNLKVQERQHQLQNISSQVDSHKDRLEHYEDEIQLLVKDYEAANQNLQLLKNGVMEGKARQKVLLSMREAHEGFSSGSKLLLKETSDAKSPLFSTLRPLYEFFNANEKVADALAIILRAYSQTLVVQTKADFKKVIDFAEAHQLQDYSLICLEWIEKQTNENKVKDHSLLNHITDHPFTRHFLQSIEMVENPDQAFELISKGKCAGGWCLNGSFIDHRGVLFKSLASENQVFLRELELKKLDEDLSLQESELQVKEKFVLSLGLRRTQLLEERSEVDKMLRRDEMKLVEANFNLQKTIADFEKNKKDQESTQSDLDALINIIEESRKKLLELEKQFLKSQSDLIYLQEDKDHLEKDLTREEFSLKKQQQDQKEKGFQYHQLADQRQQLLHQSKVIDIQDHDDQRQVLRIEDENIELDEQLIILKDQESSGTIKIQCIEKELQGFKESYSEKEKQRKELADQLLQTEKQCLIHQDDLKKVEQDLNQLRIQIAQQQVGGQGIENELMTRFQLTIEEAIKLDLPIQQTLDSIEKEINRLKKLIESAGDVNLTAIEELEKQQVRFVFLKQQMDDMEISKAELIEIIRQLDEECRQLFKVTFDAIRLNFQKNFQILFNGGEADLQLTDSNDLLEAGIEISAKPPGKQMRSISLLSGGEKCLTAVALLFAIFEVKPAPFCILDEIDAPLDDANVDRFVNVVKHFVDRCQFLIITHNKRTMAIGDVLFGVSMEEKGVSKLLSLEFARKEACHVE